ncbi:MAG: phenylacetate--CoA ligase [Candidatus Latescibacterota bacterium]|nr:MAG: phenylacetate--CoA ligase [Candidatus Latescibacterota bacterium]
MFWEREVELLPREELEALQVKRLRETVARALSSPHYGKVLGGKGISPEDIRSLEDLRRIPFTTKEDLRRGFPYGFLAVPKDEVVRLHASSGTTGTPTVVYHTRRDLEVWADLVARCLYMVGMRKEDVFQNMMSYGLFTGGLGLHYGAERIGALVIPSGAGNSRRQITLMRQFGTTAIHIIPSYALKLLETFQEMGLDPKEMKLRMAFVGAEPHTEEVRRRIEEAYGIDAFNSYGLSEMNGPGVAFECPYKEGMHVWEDSYILEVIDPETLEPVPDGEEGELVLTTLRREAMPLLRYRTGDLAFVYPDPCPCGRTHRRISRIKGRTDDMFIIKGVNVFPMQVEQVLMAFPEVGNNYVIVLEKAGPMDEMVVRIEVREELLGGGIRKLEELKERVKRALREEILVTPKVEFVEPGGLPSGEGKAVRVIDRRSEVRGPRS